MTTAAAKTFFPTSARGAARESLLTNYRYGLRQLTNPDTGQPFTDSEIQLATNEKSDAYRRADALDAVLFVMQQRGLYLSQQWDPAQANSSMLQGVHGYLWGETYLPASGGSGTIAAPCNPLTTFSGSTTLGDPAAARLTDAESKTYQVLFTVQAGGAETAVELSVAALSSGAETNLSAGTQLTWSNPPIGAIGQPTVIADFQGGGPAETDAQFAARILRKMRHKSGAGNNAQQREWAEQAAGSAVESAFVYACARHAGSLHICILQRRRDQKGPSGQVPSVGTIAAVTAYVVPPGSPVQPAHVFATVTGFEPLPTDMVLGLSMPFGSDAGWADLQPWPTTNGTLAATITMINVGGDPYQFRLQTFADVPTGVTQPQLMVWHATLSRWEKLAVQSVFPLGGNLYSVYLLVLPTTALAVGDVVSPYTALAEPMALAIESFFDSLGPGEIVDVAANSAEPRRPRAARFPRPNEEYPMRAGQGILTYIQDAFGSNISDSSVLANTNPIPGIPIDPINGPQRVVAGNLGIYVL